MNIGRRGFLGMLGATVAGAVAKPASLFTCEPEILHVVPQFPEARLTIHYNRVFMQWLYLHLNEMRLCAHVDIPDAERGEFLNFIPMPLETEA